MRCRPDNVFGGTLSVIATITFFLMFDVLSIQHSADRASRSRAWRFLHHLMTAAVLVYHFGTHVCRVWPRQDIAFDRVLL